MEWEVSVEQVVEESQRVRALVVEEDMEVLEMPGQEATDEVPCNLPVVVVDTNVLLHALTLVQTLVEMGQCVVFLTWMVIIHHLLALLSSLHLCRCSKSWTGTSPAKIGLACKEERLCAGLVRSLKLGR